MPVQVSGYTQKSVQARDLNFSYLEWGRPGLPEMVLLHGLTSHAHSWDVFADALQGEYHIFAPDQRGHGDTGWPDPPSYAGDNYVDDLDALLSLWGINDPFVLIGLSMGAHNTLGFASKYPDRVLKAVAVDISPNPRPAASNEARSARETPTDFASVDEMFARMREGNRIASDDMLRYRVEHNARQREDGRWTYKYSLDAPKLWRPENLWTRLPAISCPVLVIRGGESSVLSQEVAEKERAGITNAQLVVVPGSGHPVPMDRPAEFEAAVRAFLAE